MRLKGRDETLRVVLGVSNVADRPPPSPVTGVGCDVWVHDPVGPCLVGDLTARILNSLVRPGKPSRHRTEDSSQSR